MLTYPYVPMVCCNESRMACASSSLASKAESNSILGTVERTMSSTYLNNRSRKREINIKEMAS